VIRGPAIDERILRQGPSSCEQHFLGPYLEGIELKRERRQRHLQLLEFFNASFVSYLHGESCSRQALAVAGNQHRLLSIRTSVDRLSWRTGALHSAEIGLGAAVVASALRTTSG
jgi:hypothetical protein